ncbi:MAG: glycoside hydrolase family 19 protein [Holophagaceae bacterium]|uniref:Glycoside hydrolase family 19 protein n=1 Tax=Candidatus Geothrix skivensis TaxID=2954439 RepID=A0A9D7SCU1_9BACT|nr:glycoside hydrolase family 19 protein [Candidatus Geothrix skivensis]
MATLSKDSLGKILVRCQDPGGWAEILNPLLAAQGLDEPRRLAAFLAQVGHESAHFNRLEENLNYSAAGLQRTWPKRFPTAEVAAAYANNREKIANRAYGGRLGNGDEASGDGWRYRGRGLIQLTGKANYEQAEGSLNQGLVANPDSLAQDRVLAVQAALWFWDSRGLSALADAHPGEDEAADFLQITRLINGKNMGQPERLSLWASAKAVLGVT